MNGSSFQSIYIVSKIVSFDDSRKGIAKNAIWGFVFQFIIKFKGVIILPLIVHFLPKEIIGEWRLIGTSVAILLPVITLNILDGSGMFFSSDTNIRSVRIKYFTVHHITLLVTIAIILFSILFRHLIPVYYSHTIGIALYFFSLVLIKLSVFLLQTYQKAKRLVTINFILEYGSAILMLLMIVLGYRDINTLLAPIIIVNITMSAVLLPSVFSELKFSFKINLKFLYKILPVSIPLVPVFITEWLLSSIGIYFLEMNYSTEVVGSYSVLLSIASLVLTLRATLQFFWFSTCSNLLQNNKQIEFNAIFKGTIKIYLVFCTFAVLVFGFYSTQIVDILANRDYYEIINPLFLTILGYVALVFSSIWNGILYAKKRTKAILYCYVITAVVITGLSFILVKQFGILGASLAYLAGNIVLFITLYISAKGFQVSFLMKERWVNVFIISVVFFTTLINYLILENNIKMILGGILTVGFVYVVIKLKYIEINKFVELIKK